MPTKVLYAFKIWISAVILPSLLLTFDFWYQTKHTSPMAVNYLMNLSTELHLGLYLFFSCIFSLPSFGLFLFAVHHLQKKSGTTTTHKMILMTIGSFLTLLAFLPVYILEINQVQWYAPFCYIAVILLCIYFLKYPDIKNNHSELPRDIIDFQEVP